ncbi:MAG: amino acid permease [Bryobacteraceae bacterium]|nr:amino acid permease [Bryobacteraceae bacterium]
MTKGSQLELRRDLGLWGAVAIVIGTVIGSGIFLVPKRAILKVGDPWELFFVWVFGGLLSLAGALTYAELAAAMPESGGEYVYLRAAYGRLYAFIYGWTQMWVAKSGSVATLATAFYLAMVNFAPGLNGVIARIDAPIGPNWQPLEITFGQVVAIALILGLGGVNYFGVRFGGGVQLVVTIAKVGLFVAIVFVGFSYSGSFSHMSEQVPANPGGIAGFFAALVGILWAYDGWNNVAMVSAEIEQPQKNLPKALILGTLAVMAIYLAANAAYFYVLTPQEVSQADLVPGELMRKVFGPPGATAVSIVAMVSIFAALNGSILSGSRVPFAMARDGLFFKSFGEVHPEYRSPGVSIFGLSAWSCVLVLSGRYDELYTCVIFASWILYGMAAASVIVLRKTQPELARPYRTLGYPWVPMVFVLVSALLIFYTLRDSPRESMLGLVLIAIGLPFYFHWNRQNSPRVKL